MSLFLNDFDHLCCDFYDDMLFYCHVFLQHLFFFYCLPYGCDLCNDVLFIQFGPNMSRLTI